MESLSMHKLPQGIHIIQYILHLVSFPRSINGLLLTLTETLPTHAQGKQPLA